MAIKDEYKKTQPKPVLKNDFGKPIKQKKAVLPKKGDSFGQVMSKLVFLAAVVTLIGSLLIIFDYVKQIYDTQKLNRQLASLSNEISESQSEETNSSSSGKKELLPLAKKLLEQNPDTIGWIKINNTKIDLPVVLKKDEPEGEKNQFYLTHNFLGEKSQAGTIFADYRTTIEPDKQSDNIVLYGHNEQSNEMFGDLDKYKQQNGKRWSKEALEFYKQNPTFEFDTNYEKGVYKIFAYFVTPVNQDQDPENKIFDYNNYIDFDEARYNDFMENIQKRNMIVTDIDCKFGDKFVTLSTCSDEFDPSRFVVIGRKVRDGESAEVDTTNVTYNKNALQPDYDYIYKKK